MNNGDLGGRDDAGLDGTLEGYDISLSNQDGLGSAVTPGQDLSGVQLGSGTDEGGHGNSAGDHWVHLLYTSSEHVGRLSLKDVKGSNALSISLGNCLISSSLGSLSNEESVEGLLQVEVGNSQVVLDSSKLGSDTGNEVVGIFKGSLGCGQSSIGDVEVGQGIIVALSSQFQVVFSSGHITVGFKQDIVGLIKSSLGSLNVAPSNAVSILGINIGCKGVLVIKFGLGKLVLGHNVGVVGSFESSGCLVEESLGSGEILKGSLDIVLSVLDGSLSNGDDVLGGSEIGLSSVVDFEGVVVLGLQFDLSPFGSLLLFGGKVEGELGLGLSGLLGLGEVFGRSDDLHGIDDGTVCCDLLTLDLVKIVDESNILVGDVDDVVG